MCRYNMQSITLPTLHANQSNMCWESKVDLASLCSQSSQQGMGHSRDMHQSQHMDQLQDMDEPKDMDERILAKIEQEMCLDSDESNGEDSNDLDSNDEDAWLSGSSTTCTSSELDCSHGSSIVESCMQSEPTLQEPHSFPELITTSTQEHLLHQSRPTPEDEMNIDVLHGSPALAEYYRLDQEDQADSSDDRTLIIAATKQQLYSGASTSSRCDLQPSGCTADEPVSSPDLDAEAKLHKLRLFTDLDFNFNPKEASKAVRQLMKQSLLSEVVDTLQQEK